MNKLFAVFVFGWTMNTRAFALSIEVEEPTTLFEQADLQSGRYEVQAGQQLLITEAEDRGVNGEL